MTQIPRSSLYRILKRIEEIQTRLNIQILKAHYTSEGKKILERAAVPEIINNMIHIKVQP